MQTHKHKLRGRLARAAAIGAVGLTASLVVAAGVAGAATAPGPSGNDPAEGVAPHFYNGNVTGIRGSGSDTTFFMMQKISDLFTGAGLYGCTLNNSAGQFLYNPTSGSSGSSTSTDNESFCVSGGDIATTDNNDNWDRTEVTQGVDDVGSGAGQQQLCGSTNLPTGLTVQFARSSKPAGSISGCPMVETGYAKDGVPVIDYTVNPALIAGGTVGSPSTAPTSSPYASINGGVVGPVASGWLPGDPVTGPFSGTALAITGISNADGTSGGATSTAYRLWCAKPTSGNQITDWGQLTNIGPNLLIDNVSTTSGSNQITMTGNFPSTVVADDAVTGVGIPSGTTVSSGAGTGTLTLSNNATATGTPNLNFKTTTKLASGAGLPVGIPVRLMGVNESSGTEATFASFADSGLGAAGNCGSNMDPNAEVDPNSATATGNNAGQHLALENNSDQLDQFAAADFPSPDYVDQAIEVATTLYIESNGVYTTNPYAAASTIDGQSFTGTKTSENGQSASAATELNNDFPTARTLFNIYRSDTVTASTGGFLNWICDGNVNFTKGIDNTTGKNFDNELTTVISTNNGFPRLTDATTQVPNQEIPADGLDAPNNTCAANLPVNVSSGSSTITLTAGGNFPADIVNAGGLAALISGAKSVVIGNADFPAGTTVVSGAGTSTLTLSASATTSGTGVGSSFFGVPPVVAVGSANS
jgi:hypothetical protein